MHVTNVRTAAQADYCELSADVTIDLLPRECFHLWYRFPPSLVAYLSQTGDPFVAALLAPSMACGETLRIDAPVSAELLAATPKAQSLYSQWDPSLSAIEVLTAAHHCSTSPSGEAASVGLFFSLGLDSFYSLLKNVEQLAGTGPVITGLVFVHGFDVGLDEQGERLCTESFARVSQVAQALGKTAICVSTNLRELSDRFVPWGKVFHGAALASVGLAAARNWRTMMIASSRDTANLRPWGSHPALDPLWSTPATTFVHDGCEATRQQKMRLVARHAIALEALRVCYQSEGYNCGECNKCLLTMTGLYLEGALERCSTLPATISPQSFRRLLNSGESGAGSPFWNEIWQLLSQTSTDDPMRRAVAEYVCPTAKAPSTKPAETYIAWVRASQSAAKAINGIAQPGERVVIAGEQQVSGWMSKDIVAHSFVEREGAYWGLPIDDAAAVDELEAVRRAGARYFVLSAENRWWLEYYSGFQQHLDALYSRAVDEDSCIIFDLDPRASGATLG